MIRKEFVSIFIMIALALISSVVYANNITEDSSIFLNDSNISSRVLDDNESTYIEISSKDTIKISSDNTIAGLYIVYEVRSCSGILKANGQEIKIGENGFIHEYINISEKIENVKECTLQYDSDVKITDIYVLDDGELPSFVEAWKKPCEKADLMLFSTHADDEQLFFLGLLPTYVAKGAEVQVVYFTYHGDQPIRYHEQLHGLYTVGIRHYPIIGIVPDAYSTTLDGAKQNMINSGVNEDNALKFQVEMIRRFKPQVIVGHDEKGEYSHGQHILNTYLLEKSILLSNDESYDTDSLNKYGKWNVLKLYLHLFEQNPIVMDYDTPLEYFGGKTAYEVSKEGYSKHNSQQWTWFTRWINGTNNSFTKATEIQTYSPLKFGLYYKSIDEEDINKNDFLENITLYSEQERIEKAKQEELARIEEEQRILAEQKRKEEEELNNKKKSITFIITGVVSICVILIIIAIIIKKRKKRK